MKLVRIVTEIMTKNISDKNLVAKSMTVKIIINCFI